MMPARIGERRFQQSVRLPTRPLYRCLLLIIASATLYAWYRSYHTQDNFWRVERLITPRFGSLLDLFTNDVNPYTYAASVQGDVLERKQRLSIQQGQIYYERRQTTAQYTPDRDLFVRRVRAVRRGGPTFIDTDNGQWIYNPPLHWPDPNIPTTSATATNTTACSN